MLASLATIKVTTKGSDLRGIHIPSGKGKGGNDRGGPHLTDIKSILWSHTAREAISSATVVSEWKWERP